MDLVKARLIQLFLGVTIFIAAFSLYSCSQEGLIGVYSSESQEEAPFTLSQNYPNPFNPSTTIPFYVREPVHLTLRIYDMDWIHKATLLDKQFEQGDYIVRYGAEGLATGDYFYVMKGGGETQIRRFKLYK